VTVALRDYQAQRMGRTAGIPFLSRSYCRLGRYDNPIQCMLHNRVLMALLNTMAWKVHQKDVAYPSN
jgi:hypothetical protein